MEVSLHRSVLLFLLANACGCSAEQPSVDQQQSAASAPRADSPGPDGASPNGSEGKPPSQPCGDGVCDEPEQADPSLCPRDCQEPPADGGDWCGDGICDALEEADASCEADCAEKAAANAAAAAERAARASADPDVINSGLAPAPGKVVNPPPPALSPPLDHATEDPSGEAVPASDKPEAPQ